MKKMSLVLTGLAFMAFLFLVSGCKLNSPTPNFKEFAIQVDSIQLPDTVELGKTLYIKFYGTIGPNGCYSFSRFAGGINGKKIEVEVYGKYLQQSGCPQQVQYMNGISLRINPVDTGAYFVHVMEPRPPDIYDTVHVVFKRLIRPIIP